MGLCSGFGLNTVLIIEMFLLLLSSACTELRARVGADLLFFQLEQQCKRSITAVPAFIGTTLVEEEAQPGVVVGRETSKHTWCSGTWHDGHIAGGLSLQGPHYCITKCCSAAPA